MPETYTPGVQWAKEETRGIAEIWRAQADARRALFSVQFRSHAPLPIDPRLREDADAVSAFL